MNKRLILILGVVALLITVLSWAVIPTGVTGSMVMAKKAKVTADATATDTTCDMTAAKGCGHCGTDTCSADCAKKCNAACAKKAAKAKTAKTAKKVKKAKAPKADQVVSTDSTK